MSNKIFHVLLVEDDYLDAYVTKRYLEKCVTSFELTHISDGREAMDYLLKRKKHTSAPTPDLILLDLRLPGMTGAEIIHFMNGHALLKKIPVIVISGETKKNNTSRKQIQDPYPVFTKWLAMSDFKSMAKAAEDLFVFKQHEHQSAA